jgi:drug/metabolite transporter (DMT)-like permease
MRETRTVDYFLLGLLALIWASAFFNIKIATYSYGPLTIAFLRIFFGAIPVILLCFIKKINIEAFSKDWYWFAIIGTINLVIPFFLIAYGVQRVQSNMAAILMASTPLSASLLAHFFTKNEKINLIKSIGILIGFSGIIFLFSDNLLINKIILVQLF